MIEIKGLSLLVTDKCNAACRHCGINAGPSQSLSVSLEQAAAYIATLSSQQEALLVAYTGGEPFLDFAHLKSIITIASGYGFLGEIVTNCFWATDDKTTADILKELRALRVVTLVTSLDDYHAEFVAPEFVRNATWKAIELGYNVKVKVCEDTESTDRQLSALYTLEYVKDFLAADAKNIEVIRQDIVPSGRFTALRRSHHKPLTSNVAQTVRANGRCGAVIQMPAVNSAGEVYPCCGFGGDNRLLGNTNDTPLDEIFADMKNNLLLNLLAILGPLEILRNAGKYMTQPPPADFGSICEACNYIYSDPDARSGVGKLLAEYL